MNVKITYFNNKANEERLYKLLCSIINKDIEKNEKKEREANEKEKYSLNES